MISKVKPISSSASGQAQSIAARAEQIAIQKKAFEEAIKPLVERFSEESDQKGIIQWLGKINDVLKELKDKKANTPRETNRNPDLTNTLERLLGVQQKPAFDEKLGRELGKVLKSAQDGHSIDTHDHTVAGILQVMMRELKHLGMIMAGSTLSQIPSATNTPVRDASVSREGPSGNQEKQVFDEKLGRELGKVLKSAQDGHSIDTHDHTVAGILQVMARDLKHLGMIMAASLGERLTPDESTFVGSFMSQIPGAASKAASKAARAATASASKEKDVVGDPDVVVSGKSRRKDGGTAATDAVMMDTDEVILKSDEVILKTDRVFIDPDSRTPVVKRPTDTRAAPKTDKAITRGTKDESEVLEKRIKDLSVAMTGHRRQVMATRTDMDEITEQMKVAAEAGHIKADEVRDMTLAIQSLSRASKEDKHFITSAYRVLMREIASLKQAETGFHAGTVSAEQYNAAQERVTRAMQGVADASSRATRNLNSMSGRMGMIGNAIGNLFNALRTLEPATFGIGTHFDPVERARAIRDEFGEWTRGIHAQLAQSFGMRGSLMRSQFFGNAANPNFRNAPDEMLGWYAEANVLAANYNITGQETVRIQSVLIRNLQRGIQMQSRWSAISRQGLQLGRIIGVDAEQTADVLTDWHLQMGMTVDQTGQLARDMQQVSVITGLTGDRLLEAVRATKQIADNMRSAGTLTSLAARNLMQFTATAQRMGTEQITSPLMEAMTSTGNLYDRTSAGRFAFLMQSAQMGGPGIMRSLQQGTVMQNRQTGQAMADGMQRFLMRLTGGVRIDQLDPQRLMELNLIARNFDFEGINELQLAADTFRETFMTTADRLSDINDRLARGGLTAAETADLRAQHAQLSRLNIGEQMNEAMRNLTQITRYTSSGTNLQQAIQQTATQAGRQITVRAEIDSVLAGIETAANSLTGPHTRDRRAALETALADFRAQINASENDPVRLAMLTRQMGQLLDEQQVWERMYQMDQNTFHREEQERYQRQHFENAVRQSLQHIQTWAPAEATLLNTWYGLAAGFVQTVTVLWRLLAAVWGIGVILRVMRSFMLGGGTPGAPGAPGRMPTLLPGLGLALVGGNAISGAYHGGWSGAIMQALTGYSDAPNSASEDIASVGYGVTAGALLGSRFGIFGTMLGGAFGGLTAVTTNLTSQFIRLGQAVDHGNNITQAGVDAARRHNQFLHSQAGQLQLAHQTLTQSDADIEARLNTASRDAAFWDRQLQSLRERFGERLGLRPVNPLGDTRWTPWNQPSQNDYHNYITWQSNLARTQGQITHLERARSVELPFQVMHTLLPRNVVTGARGAAADEMLRRYVEQRWRSTTQPNVSPDQRAAAAQEMQRIAAGFQAEFNVNLVDLHRQFQQIHQDQQRMAQLEREFQGQQPSEELLRLRQRYSGQATPERPFGMAVPQLPGTNVNIANVPGAAGAYMVGAMLNLAEIGRGWQWGGLPPAPGYTPAPTNIGPGPQFRQGADGVGAAIGGLPLVTDVGNLAQTVVENVGELFTGNMPGLPAMPLPAGTVMGPNGMPVSTYTGPTQPVVPSGNVLHVPSLEGLSDAHRQHLNALGMTEQVLLRTSTNQLYRMLNSATPTSAEQRQAVDALRSRIEPLVPPNERVYHQALLQSLDQAHREELARRLNLDVNMLGGLSTSELTQGMQRMPHQGLGRFEAGLMNLQRQLEAITRQQSGGGPLPAPGAVTGPGGPSGGGPAHPRDAMFWSNVNSIQDYIWDIMPNLDGLRAQQVAIAAYNEFRTATAGREPRPDEMTEIINRHLRGVSPMSPQQVAAQIGLGGGLAGLPGFAPTTLEEQIPLSLDDITRLLSSISMYSQLTAAALSLGTEEGSFYVHDIHSEDAIQTLTNQTAEPASISGIEDVSRNSYLRELSDVEMSEPLNRSVEHLGNIDAHTQVAADETREMRRQLGRLIDLLSKPGENNARTKSNGPARFWQWGVDMTLKP